MSGRLDLRGLFVALSEARIDYVLIGGMAVNAHGVIRTTKDVDICPAPDPANLSRLAALLKQWETRQLGVGGDDFGTEEMPFDPTNPVDLAQGGNFRLQTPVGVLDLMQWVPGIDTDHAYTHLIATAETAHVFDVDVRVCSLADLQIMKRAAGRPQDLQDLADLQAAHPETS